eukprot:3932771-Rhodomonas_salina.1
MDQDKRLALAASVSPQTVAGYLAAMRGTAWADGLTIGTASRTLQPPDLLDLGSRHHQQLARDRLD